MTDPLGIQAAVRARLEAMFWARDYTDTLAFSAVHKYPDGESVEVYVRAQPDGSLRVTDLGEALRWASGRGYSRRGAGDAVREAAARTHLHEADGEIFAVCDSAQSAAAQVFAVSTAVTRATEIVVCRAAPLLDSRSSFREEVTAELQTRVPGLRLNESFRGDSGRAYKVPAYHEPTHSVILTLSSGRFSAVAPVYAEISDITRVNGYKALTVIDDSRDAWESDATELLAQVSEVAGWAQRDTWVKQRLAEPA